MSLTNSFTNQKSITVPFRKTTFLTPTGRALHPSLLLLLCTPISQALRSRKKGHCPDVSIYFCIRAAIISHTRLSAPSYSMNTPITIILQPPHSVQLAPWIYPTPSMAKRRRQQDWCIHDARYPYNCEWQANTVSALKAVIDFQRFVEARNLLLVLIPSWILTFPL